jgi:hypothetical protein
MMRGWDRIASDRRHLIARQVRCSSGFTQRAAVPGEATLRALFPARERNVAGGAAAGPGGAPEAPAEGRPNPSLSRWLKVPGLLAMMAMGVGAAWAAPPAGVVDADASAWFRSLRNAQGISCCSEADCRRTAVRPGAGGGLEAWIGQAEFGAGAPDQWHAVPEEEIRSRGGRPPGLRGAIVCWYQQRVFCVDLEDGS